MNVTIVETTFSKRKSHDKIYPKGYAEMLERQQTQLIQGLQMMYHRLRNANAWNKSELLETNGQPLTHDLLVELEVLKPTTDRFEEDTQKLQQKLFAESSSSAEQQPSTIFESTQSQQSPPCDNFTSILNSSNRLFGESFGNSEHCLGSWSISQMRRHGQAEIHDMVSQPLPLPCCALGANNESQSFQQIRNLEMISQPIQCLQSSKLRKHQLMNDRFNQYEFHSMSSDFDTSIIADQLRPRAPSLHSRHGNEAHQQPIHISGDHMDLNFADFVNPSILT